MSSRGKEKMDLSALDSTLPKNILALSPVDRVDLADALKSRLENLKKHSLDLLEGFSSNVMKRVEVLMVIQGQHDEHEKIFLEERAALEAKYQKLYEPLYTKRYEVVNGIVEVEGVKNEAKEEGPAEDNAPKGVPGFWLTAMKNNEVLAKVIQERDEGALEYLKDIKWCRINEPKGFKLDFFFDTNPYFKNSILTKTYQMVDEDELILDNAIGTEIEWYPGKCLSKITLKKKPKRRSKNAKPVTKIENCESFFNFFIPPGIPGDHAEIGDDAAEKLQNQMEQDYDIGTTIRDKIIPHAVYWFTGKAAQAGPADFEDDDT